MQWYKFSQLESGFANVYDSTGEAVIVARPVRPGELMRLLQRAYYEYGLARPEYTIFQTEQQALADAESRKASE